MQYKNSIEDLAAEAKECRLFTGCSDDEVCRSLELLDAKVKNFHKGDIIKRAGESIGSFGYVLHGRVQVYICDIDGNKIIMSHPGSKESFGESMNYLGEINDVFISAAEDSRILFLNISELKKNCFGKKDDLVEKLSESFTALLARRTLDMNRRIQILSKLCIRDKVITLLSFCEKQKDGSIDVNMNREDMAAYLGVNRSALSRELSAMQKDKIICCKGSIFRLP